MAVGLGAVNHAPISGFYGWLAVDGWPIYILSIAVGSAIVAVGSLLVFRQSNITTGKEERLQHLHQNLKWPLTVYLMVR